MQRNGKESCRRSAAQWWCRNPADDRSFMIRGFWLLLITALSIHSLSAQHKSIQGIIVDKTSRAPVPYVHVFLTSGLSGAISDLNGEFSIVISSAKNDSLRFSSIGYKTQKLPVKNFLTLKRTVEFEEDRVLLPGVTIHELSAKDFIRKCVTRIPVNYIQTGNESKAFYWSSVKHRNTFTDFYEGYVRLLKKSKIQYDSTVLSIKNSAEHIQLFDSLQDVLNFDVINQASMFVNPANIDDWRFEYLYSSEHPDGSFVIIEAAMIQSPFEKSKNSNTLKIFIHTPSYAIVRVDFTYQWQEGKRYYWKEDMQYALSRLDGTVEYTKKPTQKYGLSYLFIGTEFSFMKRYNPAVLKKAAINHELVMLGSGRVYQKPVIRWNDYLDATDKLSSAKPASGQD
jgi:hypothetical protein